MFSSRSNFGKLKWNLNVVPNQKQLKFVLKSTSLFIISNLHVYMTGMNGLLFLHNFATNGTVENNQTLSNIIIHF